MSKAAITELALPVQGDQLSGHYQAAWQEIQADLGGRLLLEYTKGGHCRVFLAENERGRYVVKIPRKQGVTAKTLLGTEFNVLSYLHEPDNPAPLAVPFPLAFNIDRPISLAQTHVPGETLNYEQIAAFSDEELHDFGDRLGEFIVWLGDTVSPEAYDSVWELGVPCAHPHNRTEGLPHAYNFICHKLDDAGYTELGNLLEELSEAYKFGSRGILANNRVGHNDLRPDNLAFAREHGRWRLHGLFDFGLSQLTSVERELRYVYPLGNVVLAAAINRIEALSGQKVSVSKVEFWSLSNFVMICATELISTGNISPEFYKQLQAAVPSRDLSELERPCPELIGVGEETFPSKSLPYACRPRIISVSGETLGRLVSPPYGDQ